MIIQNWRTQCEMILALEPKLQLLLNSLEISMGLLHQPLSLSDHLVINIIAERA